MVLGLKPMGKPTTYQYLSSFGQNQSIAWSSDSNLWRNQLLIKIKFWTEPKYCMVLRLKPMGKPTTCQYLSSFGQNQGIVWSSDSNLWGNQLLINIYQVLDRTKVLHGPRTQTYGETNYLSKSSFGQNRGIVWSSDSSLWGNQLL